MSPLPTKIPSMKKITCLLFLVLLAGCAKQSDIERLEKNLGSYQYIGTSPKIRVKVLHREIGKGKYSWKEYSLTGVVEQIEEFPVNRYFVSVPCTFDFDGKYKRTGDLHVEMRDRSSAFRVEVSLIDMPEALEKTTPTITLGKARWAPVREFEAELKDNTEK